MKKLLRGLIALGVLGAGFGLITGYLGHIHPLFDTASNFRMHMAIGLLLGMPIILWLSRPFISVFAIAFCAFAFGGSHGGFSTEPLAHEPPAKRGYRLIAYNMLFENKQRDNVPARLAAYDADILFLTEFSEYWEVQAEEWKNAYPYHQHCPEWQGLGGSYVFSKFQILDYQQYCQAYSAFMVTPLMIDNQRVDIGGAHFRWPWPASGPEQISQAQAALENIDKNALVVGDFNSVPWSYSMQRIREFGGLSAHNGVGPTWLFKPFPDFMRAWIGLPIDNVMKKGTVRITTTQRLPSMGSDHMPVLIDFYLTDQ